MDTKNTYADGFCIRVASGLCCPHCGKPLAPHAARHRDQDGWRMVCQGCHRDIIVIEPAE